MGEERQTKDREKEQSKKKTERNRKQERERERESMLESTPGRIFCQEVFPLTLVKKGG